MSENAARVGDSIEHSSSMGGLIAGALIGAAVAVAVVGTGGVAAVAIVGAAVAGGAGIGEVVGSMSFARVTSGTITTGSANVFIDGKSAVRAHVDSITCDKHATPSPVIAQGSSSVFINGVPAARKKDNTSCGAVIASGSRNVFIGGATITTDEIEPEVPDWVHGALVAVGLGSATVLLGPAIAVGTAITGAIGGALGSSAGATLFGENSDEQKLMMLGGSALGGWIGTKGVATFNKSYVITAEGLGSNFGNVRLRSKTQVDETLPVAKSKPVNLPAWRRVEIDIEHIASGHMTGGSRVSPMKDLFPSEMLPRQVESAVRQAYRNGERVTTQGERVLIRGEHRGIRVEMWVNTVTRTIETAYPIGWL